MQAKIVDAGLSQDGENVWVYMTVTHGERGEQQATQVAWVPAGATIEDAELDIIEAAREVAGTGAVVSSFLEGLRGRILEL